MATELCAILVRELQCRSGKSALAEDSKMQVSTCPMKLRPPATQPQPAVVIYRPNKLKNCVRTALRKLPSGCLNTVSNKSMATMA